MKRRGKKIEIEQEIIMSHFIAQRMNEAVIKYEKV